MLRFVLVGLAARRQDAFGVDAYTKAIYTLSRNIQHSRTFMPDVLAQFRAAGLASSLSEMARDCAGPGLPAKAASVCA